MAKNVISVLVIILLLGSGCNQEELEELRSQNEKLNQTIEQKDSTIAALKKQYEQLEQKLQMVTQAVEGDSLDLGDVTGDNLKKRLQRVTDLMQTNKEQVKSLQDELRGARYQANKYRKRTGELEDEVERMDDSLKAINRDLKAKTERIEDMLSEMEEQETTISKLTQKKEAYKDSLEEKNKLLNTAYYAVGPEKELRADDVVMKKGGLLGFIGQTTVLDPAFSQSDFYIFDKSTERSITIEARKRRIEVVTPHPDNSYDLEEEDGENTVLNIKDQEKFWKAGKYLVVTY
ncbi:MAG: hypothetical protein KGY70_05425 [Bacteroidales bacterium]|nr:hypothetical protein [Bacteroidales bacterium]